MYFFFSFLSFPFLHFPRFGNCPKRNIRVAEVCITTESDLGGRSFYYITADEIEKFLRPLDVTDGGLRVEKITPRSSPRTPRPWKQGGRGYKEQPVQKLPAMKGADSSPASPPTGRGGSPTGGRGSSPSPTGGLSPTRGTTRDDEELKHLFLQQAGDTYSRLFDAADTHADTFYVDGEERRWSDQIHVVTDWSPRKQLFDRPRSPIVVRRRVKTPDKFDAAAFEADTNWEKRRTKNLTRDEKHTRLGIPPEGYIGRDAHSVRGQLARHAAQICVTTHGKKEARTGDPPHRPAASKDPRILPEFDMHSPADVAEQDRRENIVGAPEGSIGKVVRKQANVPEGFSITNSVLWRPEGAISPLTKNADFGVGLNKFAFEDPPLPDLPSPASRIRSTEELGLDPSTRYLLEAKHVQLLEKTITRKEAGKKIKTDFSSREFDPPQPMKALVRPRIEKLVKKIGARTAPVAQPIVIADQVKQLRICSFEEIEGLKNGTIKCSDIVPPERERPVDHILVSPVTRPRETFMRDTQKSRTGVGLQAKRWGDAY